MKTRIFLALTISTLLVGCGGGRDPEALPDKSSRRLVLQTEADTFAGPRSNYTVTKTSSGYSVKDNVGSEGTRTFSSSAQALKFSDVTVNLGIVAMAATIGTADLNTLVELYVAFFNRVPDADGLSYWIGQFKSGMTINQIAENFYNAAIQYTSLTGYSSTMSNSDFVKVIYQNVLGRSGANAPPEGDVQYWAGELSSGRAAKGTLVRTMLTSAHNFKGDPTWGWVTNLLDNKVTVATYFAVREGLTYNTPEDSISKGMAIAAAVTPTDAATAISLISHNESTSASADSATSSGSGNVSASLFAGIYTVSDVGISVTFTVNSSGGITSCSSGSLVVCNGSVTSTGAFTVSGNDGALPVDITATLNGTINSSGSVSGSYSGKSVTEGPFSGTFTGKKTSSGTATGASVQSVTVAGLNKRGRLGTMKLGLYGGLIETLLATVDIPSDGTYSFPALNISSSDATRKKIIQQPAGQSCAFTKRRQDHFDPYTKQLVTQYTSDIYCYENPCGNLISLGEAPAPKGLTVTKNAGDSSVTVNWTPDPWADFYMIYYGTDPKVVANNSVGLVEYQNVTTGNGGSTGQTETGNLSPSPVYYFTISSIYSSPANLDNCQSKASDVVPVTFTSSGSAPTITNVSPGSGAAGELVTIAGTNFSTTLANNTVTFNGTRATVTAATATSLTVAIPAGATTGKIAVTTAGGAATWSGSFTISTVGNTTPPDGLVLSAPFGEISRQKFDYPPTVVNVVPGMSIWQLLFVHSPIYKGVASTNPPNPYTDWVTVDEGAFSAYSTLAITISLQNNKFGWRMDCTTRGTISYDPSVPTCSSLGIAFDKVAGTLSFINTPGSELYQGAGSIVSPPEKFTGTLRFTPYSTPY